MTTVAQQNQIEHAKLIARMRNVRDAFLQTFGPPEQRTPLGKVILDELERFCGRNIPQNMLDSNGRVDALATWRKLGRWDVLETIHNAIEWRESDHVNPSSSGT
jgi:hypothetical protein